LSQLADRLSLSALVDASSNDAAAAYAAHLSPNGNSLKSNSDGVFLIGEPSTCRYSVTVSAQIFVPAHLKIPNFFLKSLT